MKRLSVLLVLTFTSCASIPDVPICRARTVNSGFCTNTVSNKDIIVDDTHLLNGKTWLDLKIESVYVPAESWAEIKKYIIKQCKKHRDCSGNIDTWSSKIDSVFPYDN